MQNNVNTLLRVPANDSNFICALEKYASMSELKEVEETLASFLQAGFRVKSKLLAVRREIRKREEP